MRAWKTEYVGYSPIILGLHAKGQRMNKTTMQARCSTAMVMFACVVAASTSHALGANVEFRFSGVMTSVSNTGTPAWAPPTLFSNVHVGDAWSLRYIFDDAQTPTSGSLFIRAIKQFELTIGAASMTLPPTPNGALGTVALSAAPAHQYDVAIPLSVPSGIQPSVGVVLRDSTANALRQFDRMPSELSLDAFDSTYFFLGPVNAPNQFRGTVTGFIPSPGVGVVCLMLGCGVLQRRRRA